MPPCNFRITGPDTLKQGEKATYQVEPSFSHPCTTKIKINGTQAVPHSEVAGIRVTQIALGIVSVEALTDNPTARITIEVDCREAVPACGPTTEGFDIGTAKEGYSLLEILSEIVKSVLLPITLPLCGLCWLLWWIDVFLNGKQNARPPWICFVCGFLPNWLK